MKNLLVLIAAMTTATTATAKVLSDDVLSICKADGYSSPYDHERIDTMSISKLKSEKSKVARLINQGTRYDYEKVLFVDKVVALHKHSGKRVKKQPSMDFICDEAFAYAGAVEYRTLVSTTLDKKVEAQAKAKAKAKAEAQAKAEALAKAKLEAKTKVETYNQRAYQKSVCLSEGYYSQWLYTQMGNRMSALRGGKADEFQTAVAAGEKYKACRLMTKDKFGFGEKVQTDAQIATAKASAIKAEAERVAKAKAENERVEAARKAEAEASAKRKADARAEIDELVAENIPARREYAGMVEYAERLSTEAEKYLVDERLSYERFNLNYVIEDASLMSYGVVVGHTKAVLYTSEKLNRGIYDAWAIRSVKEIQFKRNDGFYESVYTYIEATEDSPLVMGFLKLRDEARAANSEAKEFHRMHIAPVEAKISKLNKVK